MSFEAFSSTSWLTRFRPRHIEQRSVAVGKPCLCSDHPFPAPASERLTVRLLPHTLGSADFLPRQRLIHPLDVSGLWSLSHARLL